MGLRRALTAAVCALWLAHLPGQTPGPSACPQRFPQEVSAELVESKYKAAPGGLTGAFRTGQPADILLSGFDFNRSGGGLMFRYNSGIATDGARLLLADRGNNRVLIWNRLPETNRQPDLVLGQPNLDSNDSGSGRQQLDWPMSVATDGRRVVVADTYNDRLLIWNQFPATNGAPADLVINVQWPWGVWTNGEKLLATSTSGGTALVWNRFPERDDQPPDLRLRAGGMFGTPRTITSDGKFLIIGDHNSKLTQLGQGNFVWKNFPAAEDAPYDYFFSDPHNEASAWLQGKFFGNGRLVMLGATLHFWNSPPQSASQKPDLSISGFPFLGGDGSDVAVAGERIYVSGANGNRVLVYNSAPQSADRAPDFAIGSPDICTNTLESNFFITNPVPASSGASLFVSSDFDRKLYVWRRLPDESGARPDVVYRLPQPPWQNALWGTTLALAGGRAVYIWKQLPVDGRLPDVQLQDRIGSVRLQDLKGVAYDGRYFFLSDRQANRVYVWEGLPSSGSEPKLELTVQNPGRLASDGTWLLVSPAEGQTIQAFRLDGLTPSAQPRSIGGAGQFNLPQHALVAGGRLFVADTVFNRVHIWNGIDAALEGRAADVVLGQADRRPATRRDGLFWPGALSFDGSYLWLGEYKFSGRVLRFSLQSAAPAPMALVNAASYAPAVAPGSLISIFGGNLAGAPVIINGLTAPVLYTSPTQINAQLPSEIQPGTATVHVGGSALTIQVAPAAPGIFKLQGERAALQAGRPGDYVTIYLTGQGQVQPPVATGAAAPASPLARAVLPVKVTVGGRDAEVQYAGLAPGFVGLMQLNLRLPDLAAGDQPAVVTIGGVASNMAFIPVAGAQQPPTSLTSDFTPPKGRGCPADVRGGPCGKRLLSARSADGLTFTRTNQIVTDQGDVPDVVVDQRGWIYLYYVGATVGAELNKLVVAISTDRGATWVYKRAIVDGFTGMSDPVDPDVQILPDGTFRLYVTVAAPGERARTWYAEGTDGIRFQRKGLAFDPPGEPLDPSTVLIDRTWHIFAGGNTPTSGANWHGMSADGTSFRFDAEKLFLKDGQAHAVSNAIPVAGGYRMYAFTHQAPPVINSFFTTDGVTWSAEAGTRLTMDATAGLESAGVKDAAVARLADGSFFMVYVTEIGQTSAVAASWDLDFEPDPGIRVDNASLPKPAVSASGALYLRYEDHSSLPSKELLSISTDGLNFQPGTLPTDRANDPRRLRLPDGGWRLYQYDPNSAEMRSSGSADGLRFAPDLGVRYTPQPGDRGTFGVYDHFLDSAGGVVLLYIGDMQGVNNVRRAYSPPGDNGWTFRFDRGNVLGDAEAGGGPNSYVDQKSIRLPDRRIRLFVMKQGAIYSFISEDDGKTFRLEPGIRLSPAGFKDLNLRSLHDPWVVRLPDGRYRMYVAGAVDTGAGPGKFVIVSATTRTASGSLAVKRAYLMAFHACDKATTNCGDPHNHQVYLAESDDGLAWNRVAGWQPYAGSVPDVIRRGDTLYVFSAGQNPLVRARLDSGTEEAPTQVKIDGLGDGGFVDPSLTMDDQGRLVLFFLYGSTGGDPAGCPAGQAACTQRFGSATEVLGSDGTRFTLDPGHRATVSLGGPADPRWASDPDIFFDGKQYVLYISHGPSISVWTSAELRGTYRKVADLSAGTGGVASGHFDAASQRYWSYAHVVKDGVAVIRRAVHPDLSRLLGEPDWQTVMTGPSLGFSVTTNVESPGFAVSSHVGALLAAPLLGGGAESGRSK